MRFVRPASASASASAIAGASAGRAARHEPRQLGGANGDYLVDSNGNEVPSYSLSWRLLGVFVDDDCGDRRRLGDDGGNSCRKVLWAAYHDPEYEGNSIAEYSFFQRESGKWDDQTCKAQTDGHWWEGAGTRCRRLDCHEKDTELELVGVFKETDGLYDFTEQLFKHQGYCLWDEDKLYGDGESHHSGDDGEEASDYQFMQNLQENWVYGCTQLENSADDNGNYLYYDTKPLPGGDMTYGVYTDASCTVESNLSWSDVLSKEGDNDDNSHDDEGLPSMDSIARWNELLGSYKICQPCRTYNRVVTYDGSSQNSGDQNDDGDQAYGDDYEGEDGEGGLERYGFNCYDDAGYQNCNQCYKFQTQTNMERASTSDLELATAQGTILGVTVGEVTYGKGYYGGTPPEVRAAEWALGIIVTVAAMVFFGLYLYGRRLRRARRVGDDDDGLEENLRGGGKRSRSRSRRRRNRGRDDDNWRVYVATASRKLRADARGLVGFSGADPASEELLSSKGGKRKFTYKDCKKKYLVAQLENRDARLAEQEEQMRDLREKVSYYKYLLNNANCTSGEPVANYEEQQGAAAFGVPVAHDEEQQGAEAGEDASQDKERSETPSTTGTDVEQQGANLDGEAPQDMQRYIPPPSVEADVEQQGSDLGGEVPQEERRSEVDYYKSLLNSAVAARASGAPAADEEQPGAVASENASQDKDETPPSAETVAELQGSDPGGASSVPAANAGQQVSDTSGETNYSTLPLRQPGTVALMANIDAAERMKQMAEGALARIKAREAQQRKQDEDDE